MAENSNFGDALMLLGMGMQGNSQGISDYFKAKQEAERQKQITELMAGLGSGLGNRTQAIGALAQLDPIFVPQYLQETDPAREMEMQIKRAQIENINAERASAQRAAANRDRILGMQTPNFNPAIPTDGYAPSAIEQLFMSDAQANQPPSYSEQVSRLQQAVQNRADMPQGRIDINEVAGQLGNMPPMQSLQGDNTRPMPLGFQNDVMQQGAAYPAQSSLMSIDQWRDSTNEGQAARMTGDEDKLYSAYSDYVKNFRANQQEAMKRQGEVSKPTEGNLSAAGFVNRMINAENKLSELPQGAEAGRLGAAGYVEQALAALPLGSLGNRMGEGLIKMATTPEQQVYLRNAEDWIRAKLRKESGAVIAEEEMAAEYANYFPMPGDSQDVLADKANRRKIAIESMRIAAGPANTPQQLKETKSIDTPAGKVTFKVIGQ